ncbi:hypothetical protein HYH03_017837 [Edaphochlamys debaryana]|uniref:Protein kinase domain-containing protein n=1 Tax=Edaphochlamys debaryana TaxID=47281 RepID=A0A835XLP6_9CHLO|nr:hypothetical protein HYH03_017837 [Edaphochlamys debaryana]|eukprot:KAG2483290.1 hypothetical protein HYH03_017837 [Edaphochlamys debaryana]
MSEDCVKSLGPIGCYFFVTGQHMSPSPSVMADARTPEAPANPEEGSTSTVMIAVLASVLGGLALLAVVAAAVVLLRRRAAQRRAGEQQAEGGKAGGGPPPAKKPRGLPQEPSPDSLRRLQPWKGGVWVAPIARGASRGSGLVEGDPMASGAGGDSRPGLSDLPVTPFTPQRPDLLLGVACGEEVTLLDGVLGRGTFGVVREGLFQGQKVAVKLLTHGPLPATKQSGGGGRGGPKEAINAPPDKPEAAPPAADGGLADFATDSISGDVDAAGVLGEGEPVEPQADVDAEAEAGPGAGVEAKSNAGGKAGKGKAEGRADGACSVGPATPQELATFAAEVEVLGRCCHPNVVRLLAACLGPPQPCLVYELCETSLDRLIYAKPRALLPLPTVLRIAIDIARGLSYLHPTIVHRDLKPANVLVNLSGPQPVAKLSDFGLSRLRATVAPTHTPEAGTPAYTAPECFDTLNTRISHQADVYSLGVVVWECLTGLVPWWGCSPVAVAYTVTMLGQRLPLNALPPERLPARLSGLLTACWEHDPLRRPAAAELVKSLQAVLHQVREAPAPAAGQPAPAVLEPTAPAVPAWPPPAWAHASPAHTLQGGASTVEGASGVRVIGSVVGSGGVPAGPEVGLEMQPVVGIRVGPGMAAQHDPTAPAPAYRTYGEPYVRS